MSIDWKRLEDMQHDPDVFSLSEDTLALCLSLVTSFPFRGEWLYDGNEVTNAQWDTIEAAVSLAFLELTQPYVCPPSGGAGDYTLISDVELTVDTASYTFSSLDTLDGNDLRIEVMSQTTNGNPRDLNVQVNGLTTSIYKQQWTKWQGSTIYYSSTGTKFAIVAGVAKSDAGVDYFAWVTIDIPNFKDTNRYPIIFASGGADGRDGRGRAHVLSETDVDSILLWPSAGNFKPGTRLKVYARG